MKYTPLYKSLQSYQKQVLCECGEPLEETVNKFDGMVVQRVVHCKNGHVYDFDANDNWREYEEPTKMQVLGESIGGDNNE